MRLLSVLLFLTLVGISSKNWAAPQNDYPQPSFNPSTTNDDDIVASHHKENRSFNGFSFDMGLAQGYFYDKNESKSVFYIGTSKEFQWDESWWSAAFHLGSGGHAFAKLGKEWFFNDENINQTGLRLYFVNDLEVSQYFASLVNYNHYKLELNFVIKNIFESWSGLNAEAAAGYGLNGAHFSFGLSYSF